MQDNRWQQSMRDSFRSVEKLASFLDYPVDNLEIYPVFIPQKIAMLIKEQGPSGPLFKQFVPTKSETDLVVQKDGHLDPIGDEAGSQGHGIIQRYENRILFTPTTICPINCRYCFRKNELSTFDFFKANLLQLRNYLQQNDNINEVILTGGDPLVLSDPKLEEIFIVLKDISTIKYVRIHSRVPVILPERITDNFISVLQKFENYFKIIMAIHTNHASEFTAQTKEQILKLSQTKAVLLSQSVLLKGVNDTQEDLINLIYKLDECGIRPYYLHHPDIVKGAMHFRLSLEEGRVLYVSLRAKISGWLLPQYVIDSPLGKGKVSAFNPESISFSGKLLDLDGNEYIL